LDKARKTIIRLSLFTPVRKKLREEKTFKDEFDGLNALIKM